jgi:hypothetical protein
LSWDIFAQDLPTSITSLSDIPDDVVPQPLGKRVSLIAKIMVVAPQADFADPSWGKIRTPDYGMVGACAQTGPERLRGPGLPGSALSNSVQVRKKDPQRANLFPPNCGPLGHTTVGP